jgi:hypothetical protein
MRDCVTCDCVVCDSVTAQCDEDNRHTVTRVYGKPRRRVV